MPTRRDLQKLAKLRLREAEHLERKGLYDGCVYLCGYVVEFALKARICRVLGLRSYPDEKEVGRVFKTHNFDVLKLLAGLEEETSLARNKALFNNWSTATEWRPEYRYLPPGTYDKKKARQVLSSIKNRPNGVLTWLSKQW